MNNVWFTSDLHFGHANIIKYENRPFSDVDEMEEALIENWNSVVQKNDNIFILGDLFFKGGKDKANEILGRLQGYKTLVLGNHDNSSLTWWNSLDKFHSVSKHPIIYGKFYMCSHKPLYMNDHMPYMNIHGHLHSKKMEGSKYFNVSVELHDYKPVNFETIKKHD